MNLSPHFTLAEFVTSEIAARDGIDNDPPIELLPALKRTALGLEVVRIRLGAPVIITSGYRSPALNAAVKGAKDSQHMRGEAADFICPGFGQPQNVCAALRDSGIEYDQLILEFANGRGSGWTHISFAANPRGQALIIDKTGTRPMWG